MLLQKKQKTKGNKHWRTFMITHAINAVTETRNAEKDKKSEEKNNKQRKQTEAHINRNNHTLKIASMPHKFKLKI